MPAVIPVGRLGALLGFPVTHTAAHQLIKGLVTNSVLHSGSAVPGGLVTVAVTAGGGGIGVEVTDRSGGGAPVLSPAAFADGDAEGSRGMGLVDELAARWGYWRGGGFTTTWFELAAG